jgi:CBS domain containing-hemolysin-like protein
MLLYKISYPFIIGIIHISEFFLRVFFKINSSEKKYKFSSADINNLIEEFKSEDEKEEEKEEIKIFQNALEFQELKLRECLVPRTELKALPKTASIDDLLEMFIETGHSKILLFENDIDNIIGYIHAYDIFKKPESVHSIIRTLDFYPETMQAKLVLNKMIVNQKSISVVLDEFGGTAGIVTLEDLIEEIFGDIEDEFDEDETIDEQINESTYLFSSRLEIDFINDKYNLGLPESENFETLGGFIIDRYENIPDKGEVLNIENLKITILESTSTKIELIKLEVV